MSHCKRPVALLVFNRPATTERVFEAIREAQPERLLVVADGPRTDRPGERELCDRVRAIVESVDWPCEVKRNYADANMGCKMRVSSGLDWVFDQVEEAIILEDDCLPHPDFFRFCEEMLERYRDAEEIKMIQGMNYLPDRVADSSYFFSRYFAVWGWATWRRAWNGYDVMLKDWPERKKTLAGTAWYYTTAATKHVQGMFDTVHSGKIDTWDYQWLYHCVMNRGLSIVPKTNLISNIGDEGVHAAGADDDPLGVLRRPTNGMAFPLVHPDSVNANETYDRALLKTVVPNLLGKVRHRLKAMFS